MTNDLVSSEQKSAISQFLAELNLPSLLAGEAGKAISRLIGKGVDYPAAWVERLTEGVKDGTRARSQFSDALAKAAANQAIENPELVERAAEAFLSREVRKQANREAVATRAIEHLQGEDQTAADKAKSPDEDWMNVFERYAEDATSERLRDLWGRVLAGEIRKPGSFSLQTMRFVSELDTRTANLFDKHAQRVLFNDFIPYPATSGEDFAELLELQEAGLVSGVGGRFHKSFDPPNVIPLLPIPSADHAILVHFEAENPPKNIRIDAVILTRIGKELYQMIAPSYGLEQAREFAEKLPKTGVSRVVLVKSGKNTERHPPIDLWVKPAQN